MNDITSKDIAKFRNQLKSRITDCLIDLGWTPAICAHRYGLHLKGKPYTQARINQLINCNRGEEENSESLCNWLQKQKVPVVAV